MNVIAFLIVGLFAGWIASMMMEGHGMGALGDIIVGVIGAFVGGFIFNVFNITGYGFWANLGMSVVGAVVFLFIVGLFQHRHGPTPLER